MIICIALVGMTLVSLGIFYQSYQSNLTNDEMRYNEAQDKSVAEGKIDFNSLEVYQAKTRENFNNVVIFHGAVIGFFILSEIGLLIVLPKEKRNING